MDIKSVLKKYGVTTYELAERMNIKQPSVMQYVNGNPTAKKLEEMARAIGCSPAEFFCDWQANGASGAENLPFDNQPEQQEEQAQPQGTALVGLVRCPQCGRAIRLFSEE